MSINAQPLLSGTDVQASADNAIATATIPAISGVQNFFTGFNADYDKEVSAFKTVTVTRTVAGASVVRTYNWDFTNGPFTLLLPGVVHGQPNSAITVALAASGTGATTGYITAYYFTN